MFYPGILPHVRMFRNAYQRKCTEYTSVISIEETWPMNSIKRGSEFGVACQHPDGRWEIVDSTTKGPGWW